MTRRGSLTYYGVAVVVGCFFVSVGYALFGQFPRWHGGPAQVSSLREFFLLYFLSIPFGGFSAIVFGLVLRRLAFMLRFRHALLWGIVGAVVAPGLIWASVGLLGAVRAYRGSNPVVSQLLPVPVFLFIGSELLASIWWVTIPAGMATAVVLCAIHRAFEPRADSAGSVSPQP
jgi:hypothetical protein